MRLLVVTQTVDLDNPVLGFFHGWIEELASRYESVVVICLFEGRHSLPANVEVFSLGKEKREAHRPEYAQRFLALAWGLRSKYDSVFVHMNQEYVLIAGWLWKLLGKKIYLWRNHFAGNYLTDIAVFFCAKVFCTSAYSYIAKSSKNILMPLGIDTDIFKPVEVQREKSILSIGRIAPSKRLEVLIDAVARLAKDGTEIKVCIYGNALPDDTKYMADLKKKAQEAGIAHLVQFQPGVRNTETPSLYSAHEIFVNCSKSGMYDKTIFEAAACGALSIASSEDYAKLADTRLVFDGSAADLAFKLKTVFALSSEQETLQEKGMEIAQKNSLAALGQRLKQELESI